MDGGAVITLAQVIWGGFISIRLAKHEINLARKRFEILLTYTSAVRAFRNQLFADLEKEEPETLALIDRTLNYAEELCDIYRNLLMEKSGDGKGGRPKPITPKRQRANAEIPLKDQVLWVLKSREIFRLYEGQTAPDTEQSLRDLNEDLRRRMNDWNRQEEARRRDSKERVRRTQEIARFLRQLLFATELPRVAVDHLEVAAVDEILRTADGPPMNMWLKTRFLAKEEDIGRRLVETGEGTGVGKVLSSQ